MRTLRVKDAPWRLERDEKENTLDREEQNKSERNLLQSFSVHAVSLIPLNRQASHESKCVNVLRDTVLCRQREVAISKCQK